MVSPENLASCYKVSLLQELMAKWERQMYKERTWLQVSSCWLEADAGSCGEAQRALGPEEAAGGNCT